MNDAGEIVIGGTGEAYVAPAGTALPNAHNAGLNGAFNSLGYHTEDGVSVNQSQEILRVRGWQSALDLRRERQSQAFRITFALLQWNEINVPFAFGGGDVVAAGSGYKFEPATVDDPLDERALVVDVEDGDYVLRFVIPKGNVVEPVNTQFTDTQASALSVAFEALAADDGALPWYFFTNHPAFADGS